MTKKQLALYVKINFLILALFVVLSLMAYLRNKGMPFFDTNEKKEQVQRPAKITLTPLQPFKKSFLSRENSERIDKTSTLTFNK